MGSRNGPLWEEAGGTGCQGGSHSGSQGGRAHDMSPPAGAGRASGETGMEARGAQRSRDPAVGLEQEVQGTTWKQEREKAGRRRGRDGGIT